MAKLREGSVYQVMKTESAITFLKLALSNARLADSPKLAASIKRALKSADGARRHAQRRANAMEGR